MNILAKAGVSVTVLVDELTVLVGGVFVAPRALVLVERVLVDSGEQCAELSHLHFGQLGALANDHTAIPLDVLWVPADGTGGLHGFSGGAEVVRGHLYAT